MVCAIDRLKKETSQVQNTFSAVFPGFIKDERKYIDYIISKTNVSPHFVTPDDEGMINEMEKLFWHQEEPFGSASIYVQFCVMRLAKENNVTVLLDGQGADEYLSGYHSYYTQFFNDLRVNYPAIYANQFNEYVNLHKDNLINEIMKKDFKYFVRSRMPNALIPIKRLLRYYKQKKSSFFSNDFYTEYNRKNLAPLHHFKELNGVLHQSILQGGLQTLLRYADRNSMSQSREVRLPFLSHELVEFVFSLPPYFKINHGWTKWIMRSAFSNLLPQQIAWRKDKIGYEPPQKNWLENPAAKEKIHESKRKLYNENVISKKELDRRILTENFSDNNKAWSLWMAGNMLK